MKLSFDCLQERTYILLSHVVVESFLSSLSDFYPYVYVFTIFQKENGHSWKPWEFWKKNSWNHTPAEYFLFKCAELQKSNQVEQNIKLCYHLKQQWIQDNENLLRYVLR